MENVDCHYCIPYDLCDLDNPGFDDHYCTIGKCLDGFNMFFRAGGVRPPAIITSKWNNARQRNEDIAIYLPKFCPECGRRLRL